MQRMSSSQMNATQSAIIDIVTLSFVCIIRRTFRAVRFCEQDLITESMQQMFSPHCVRLRLSACTSKSSIWQFRGSFLGPFPTHDHFRLPAWPYPVSTPNNPQIEWPFELGIWTHNPSLMARRESYNVHGWYRAHIEHLVKQLWHRGLVRNIWCGGPDDALVRACFVAFYLWRQVHHPTYGPWDHVPPHVWTDKSN